jgi:hypothetical protein
MTRTDFQASYRVQELRLVNTKYTNVENYSMQAFDIGRQIGQEDMTVDATDII